MGHAHLSLVGTVADIAGAGRLGVAGSRRARRPHGPALGPDRNPAPSEFHSGGKAPGSSPCNVPAGVGGTPFADPGRATPATRSIFPHTEGYLVRRRGAVSHGAPVQDLVRGAATPADEAQAGDGGSRALTDRPCLRQREGNGKKIEPPAESLVAHEMVGSAKRILEILTTNTSGLAEGSEGRRTSRPAGSSAAP